MKTKPLCGCVAGYAGDHCDKCAFLQLKTIPLCMCVAGYAIYHCDKCAFLQLKTIPLYRCVAGYAGDHCDKCAPGFYNFPNCRACNCHPAGTDPEACT